MSQQEEAKEAEADALPKTRSEFETGAESGAVCSGLEHWKSEAPYQTTTSSFAKKWTAHCHCGRIRCWLSRDAPLAVKFCHCIDCQALHGAPFQWAAVFEKTDLRFERGAEGLAFYHTPDRSTVHRLPCKVSCAYCHSPIMDEGRKMVLIFPGIIEFGDAEDKKVFDPQCHIFYSQRVVDIHDGKPKWSKLDGKSELIKELGREDEKDNTVVGAPRNENTNN